MGWPTALASSVGSISLAMVVIALCGLLKSDSKKDQNDDDGRNY